jgi:DNA-binding NarL/FixJ family response regulator
MLEHAGVEVVGEASDGREALRLALERRPGVVIMDVSMPGLNGIEAARSVREACPDTHVVMLSMHSDVEHVHRAFAAGASGYLLKGAGREEVLAAVSAVVAGKQYVCREIEAARLLQQAGSGRAGPLDSLSARERQVLQLVAEGHSSAEIASLVHLSPKSVDTYRSRLMRKLGLADVAGLVKFAVRHGLTPLG